jgi:hypothetical protein
MEAVRIPRKAKIREEKVLFIQSVFRKVTNG